MSDGQGRFAFAEDDPLGALAADAGIMPGFRDVDGADHVAGPDTVRALLAAMGLAVDSPQDAADRLAARRDAAAQRRAPPEVVGDAGAALFVPVRGDWRIDYEDGGVEEGRAEARLRLTPRAGVHKLTAGEDVCWLIVAPRRAPSIADLTGRPRVWGVTAPLWGLSSARSGGLGDYADLAAAAAACGRAGAAFIGVNPTHALGAAHGGISPYSPSSRIAYATAHIAPEAAPGFASNGQAAAFHAEAAQARARAREGDLAQHAACAAAAAPVLRALFEATPADDGPFARWLAGAPAGVRDAALFDALSLRMGEDWRDWPAAWRDRDGAAVRRFAAERAEEPRWHLWLQFLADRQLAAAQSVAREAGMALGLYADLAVGVRPDGADVWAAPGAYAHGVSLGAPPDRLAPGGQIWGLAPFSPDGLRALGYAPFRAALRAAMRHAGMVRIDHVIGLMRSFWAPLDGAPGGYVATPLDALLALVRLEASRAGCAVVGEDLGTVPDGLRARLAASGLYGCAVMQFERDDAGFRAPRAWREAAVASFGTHDTPTIRGWMRGRDIDWRERLGDFDAATADAARDGRAADRAALARMLTASGAAVADGDEDATAAAVTAALMGAPSAIAAVSLEDAFGCVEQANLPGVVDRHPNWRRRLPCPVDAMEDAPALRALSAAARRAGR